MYVIWSHLCGYCKYCYFLERLNGYGKMGVFGYLWIFTFRYQKFKKISLSNEQFGQSVRSSKAFLGFFANVS